MNGKIHRNSLQPGYKLHWYKIKSVLGQGGFGITYLASDLNLHRDVAIKEYLPVEFSVREGEASVYPVSDEHAQQFKWGLQRFITEARTLAKFKHPNIVPVMAVFEENNTGYMVMNYEDGQSLQERLAGKKTLAESELIEMLFPLLDGLELIHSEGFIHRDIKPGNIFIRADGSPVLLDFGSARQAMGEETKTLTSMVSPGYAPYEQYSSKSNEQGAWTDIYGLGATLYRSVTGISPVDAVNRGQAIMQTSRDTYVSAVELCAQQLPGHILSAIDHALQFKYSDRPQSISEWRKEFNETDAASILNIKMSPTERHTVPGTVDVQSKARSYVTELIFLLCASGLFFYYFNDDLVSMMSSSLTEIKIFNSNIEGVTEAQENIENKASEITKVNEQEQAVASLLVAAEKHFNDGRFIEPAGKNALENYLQVLSLEADNEHAQEGKKKIIIHFVNAADEAIQRSRFNEAENYFSRADIVDENSLQTRIGRAHLIEERVNAERIALADEKKKFAQQRQDGLQRQREIEGKQRRIALEKSRQDKINQRLLALEKERLEEQRLREMDFKKELVQIRLVEEKRKQQVLAKKVQYNRLLYEGQQALTDKDFGLAISKFQESQALQPDGREALKGLARAKKNKAVCERIIGSWDWFNGGKTTFSADGSLTGEHRLLPGNTGSWECAEPETRKFTVRWDRGNSVYNIFLSATGERLEGTNQQGDRVTGKRRR